MNEIKQIHLGRQPFTISVEAHEELRNYLAAITAQVDENTADVIDEVELRMAELLTERGISSDKVVLPKDVKFLKEQLGEPRDFGDDTTEYESLDTSTKSAPTKRLFRDAERGMIAGVAAGLAVYFNVDPLIVRILFVLLTFSGGAGALIYILLWLLVPPVKSGSDRVQMSGKAVTVDNIREAINQADVIGTANRARRTIVCGATRVIKVILTIVGIALIVWSTLILLADVTVLSFSFVHGLQMGGKMIFPVGLRELIVVVAGFVEVLIIVIISMLAGRAMIRHRWGVPSWAIAALIALFIAGGAVGSATGLAIAPEMRQRIESVEHSEWRPTPPFTEVSTQIGEGYKFIPDVHYGIEIRTIGPVNTSKITTSITNGQLMINSTDISSSSASCFLICPYGPNNVEIIIHAPESLLKNGLDNIAVPPMNGPELPMIPYSN